MALYTPYSYNYNQGYNPNTQNYIQQPMQQMQQTPPPIQDGGFVTVHTEDEARTFPVTHGKYVKFFNENAPYIYTKTQGYGLYDAPIFEKYRLVKEEPMIETAPQDAQKGENTPQKEKTDNLSDYVSRAEYEEICARVDRLNDRVESLRKELGE